MAANWTEANIPAQDGRIALITGANSGLGFQTARFLAQHGASVILAVRSPEKGRAAEAKIREFVPNAIIEVLELDVSKQASVRAFAEKFKSTHDRLDLLVNNAGVMMTPFQRTEDGWELQFATNHLGHFALTGLLLPLLLERPDSRVTTVTSFASNYGKIHWDDPVYASRTYNETEAYAQSKLANLLFAWELQRRFEDEGRTTMSTVAHPGFTLTDLQRHSLLWRTLGRFLAMEPPQGALSILRVATDPEVRGGDFYGPTSFKWLRGYPKKLDASRWKNATRFTVENQRRLWELSEELTGVTYNF